jgi:hypothetical protein
MNPKKNNQVLTDAEFGETVNRLGGLIPVTVGIMGKGFEQKITKHISSIASYDVMTITHPANIFNTSTDIRSDGAVIKFYKQLQYHLLSTRTAGCSDFYIRLCNNIVNGLVNNQITDYNFNTDGGILDLATALYKKDFVDYFFKPTKEKVLRSFLLDHPHLVIQLLIMQFYQNSTV